MSRILQRPEYRSLNGKEILPFWQWIKTLSIDEQEKFEKAKIRQHQYRQEVIDRGDMMISDQGYIWRDQSAVEKNKLSDPVWLDYWDRWIKECNIDFKIIWEQIE